MKETYTVKYRQPGQVFWRKLKNVKGDAVEKSFRWFHLEDDTIVYISLDAEVIFTKERQRVIEFQMSKEAGQPVQRS